MANDGIETTHFPRQLLLLFVVFFSAVLVVFALFLHKRDKTSVSATLPIAPASSSINNPAPESEWVPIRAVERTSAAEVVPGTQSPTNDSTPWQGAENFERLLGPFAVEGHTLTVKLSETRFHTQGQTDDETVKALQVVDEEGRIEFTKSFASPNPLSPGFVLVDALILEGESHQALLLTYDDVPSAPDTGSSYQLLAFRENRLQALNREPIDCDDAEDFHRLATGGSTNSRRLQQGEVFQLSSNNHYVLFSFPVRVNWSEFRLEERSTPEYEVTKSRQTSEVGGIVHLFSSPDAKSASSSVTLTTKSNIQLLRVRIGLPTGNKDPANTDWLKVRIDDQEGWILGESEYEALGLSFFG